MTKPHRANSRQVGPSPKPSGLNGAVGHEFPARLVARMFTFWAKKIA
ncbi:hypothetical protein GOL22_31975 [Sinorhizobium medicae]|nr:hypothetical protein [Sinorhizobium medicae]